MFTRRQRVYLFFKRVLDIILSILAIIVFSPLFIIISILIKLTSKGPVLFRQKRIGKQRNNFYILKFRTMRIEAPSNVPTHMLENPDMFITRIGRFLRKTSLDEIPQAFNILVGQMSIVGPRPALWNQEDLIIERDKSLANQLRPGLSGWAQCNGRDTLTIEHKARLDGEYAQKFSLLMDLRIIFMTIAQAFRGKDNKEGKTKS